MTIWDAGNLNLSEKKKPEMLPQEYARQALQLGLILEQRLGTNPYKFGMIGSTDSHTSLVAVEEDNFFGKHSGTEPNAHRAEHVVLQFGDLKIMGWQQVSSGFAGVWAKENTREALFDAMKRKETYATTGSRMIVRFFGGWDFVAADAQSRLPAFAGYSKGVPMGGDLRAAPAGKAPTFLVAALKDPLVGQPRPHPDRQGLDRRAGQAPGKNLRRGVGRRGDAQAGRRRQAAAGGQHGRRREGDLDQHHRRLRADRGVEGPAVRSQAARRLLRACARDPDAALDRVRRRSLQREDGARGADDDPGARLHLADLVHAVKVVHPMKVTSILVAALALSTAAASIAQEPAPSEEALKGAFPAQKSYSPYAGRNFPTRVFWGDTHLHTGAVDGRRRLRRAARSRRTPIASRAARR